MLSKFRKALFLGALLSFMGVGSSAVVAADCVEAIVELPSVIIAGPGSEGVGFFELTNCGDEAGTVSLEVSISINSGTPITLAGIPIPLGAGETISRDFKFLVPLIAAGNTVDFCITATLGTATSTSCASVSIEAASGGEPGPSQFGFIMPSPAATECVEVDLELPDTISTGVFGIEEGFFELTNCGDAAADIGLEVSIDYQNLSLMTIPVTLGAGETISERFEFPVPPFLPTGEFTICVIATSGAAVSTVCQTVVITSGAASGEERSTVSSSNYPNPFNPDTQIQFTLPKATNVSLTVYNLLGQEVKTLISGGSLGAGTHTVTWDGTGDSGQNLASGIYFYRLVTDGKSVSRTMTLLK